MFRGSRRTSGVDDARCLTEALASSARVLSSVESSVSSPAGSCISAYQKASCGSDPCSSPAAICTQAQVHWAGIAYLYKSHKPCIVPPYQVVVKGSLCIPVSGRGGNQALRVPPCTSCIEWIQWNARNVFSTVETWETVNRCLKHQRTSLLSACRGCALLT